MQFVVFEKFTTAYYTKLHKKSCYLLVIYMKKASQKVKADKTLTAVSYLLVAPVLKNALVFSQSDVHNYFIILLIRKYSYMLNDSHTMSLPVYKALLSLFLSLSLWCLKASSLISLPPSPSLPQMKKKIEV